MPRLVIRDPQGTERTHEIVDDVTTIGRGSGNIIQTKDREASRQHCRVEKTPDGYRLVDNRSRNGTFLNGAKVDVQALKPGDEIRIGEFRIFFDPPPPGAAAAPSSSEDFAATVEVAPLDEKKLGPAPGGEGKPKYVLEVVEGRDKGKIIELTGDTLTIGRHSSNKYPIDDEAASNYHAEITREPTGYFITDLGSTNGTRVGGEKIVKTRLSSGAAIQIGTTKMVFKNVGGKAEDDEVFGTVVLDTERLERELAEDEARSRAAFLKRLALGAAVVVLAGVGVAVWLSLPAGDSGSLIAGNLLPNASFDGGVSPKGDPEGWRSVGGRLTPWQVLNDVDRLAGRARRGALVVSRESDAAPNEYAECSAQVETVPDRAYKIGGWLRTEGAQGAYGFRIRWLGPFEQRAVDQVYVMGAHPEWRELSRVVTPPPWARRAEVACFAYGNRGKVYFDDVYLVAEKGAPGGPAPRGAAYDRIRVDGSGTGTFDVKSGPTLAARSGALFISPGPEAESTQELAETEDFLAEKGGVVFKGSIPELENYELVRFVERIRPAETGVAVEYELRAERPVPLARAGLRFTVGAEFGALPMQAYDSEGRPVELDPKGLEGARELVLTSSAGEKLAVYLRDERTKFSVEPLGDEKLIEVASTTALTAGRSPIRFGVEFSTASRFERRDLELALKAVREAREAKDVSAEREALDRLIALAGRFPKEAELARKDLELLLKRVSEELSAARGLLSALKVSAEGAPREALEAQVRSRLEELKAKYPREPFAADVVQLEREHQEVVAAFARGARERQAQITFDKLIEAVKEERLAFARAYLKTLTTEYPDTEAAKKAQERGVPGLVEGLERRLADRDAAFARLERRVRMWETAGMAQEAIRLLEADPDFVRYKDDPRDPRFRDLRARLLKKAEPGQGAEKKD